jgi:hypothetical protein
MISLFRAQFSLDGFRLLFQSAEGGFHFFFSSAQYQHFFLSPTSLPLQLDVLAREAI